MRDREFTRDSSENNFKEMITNGQEFSFDQADINQFRQQLASLIDMLSAAYLQQVKNL